MKTNEQIIGEIGENIVFNYFNGIQTDNWYDSEKDGTIDGVPTEVKTQIRWKNLHSFTVYETATENQIHKCLSVDKLYFVEPGRNGVIRIFECTDRSYIVKYPKKTYSKWKKAYLFDIHKMNLITSFTDTELNETLVSLSKTDAKWLV